MTRCRPSAREAYISNGEGVLRDSSFEPAYSTPPQDESSPFSIHEVRMSDLRFFLPISKIDKPRRMVWGYASTPTLDLDDEIVDIDALKAALPSYMEWR